MMEATKWWHRFRIVNAETGEERWYFPWAIWQDSDGWGYFATNVFLLMAAAVVISVVFSVLL
jgi:hypothetical protein